VDVRDRERDVGDGARCELTCRALRDVLLRPAMLALVLVVTSLGWLNAFTYTRRVAVRDVFGCTRYQVALAETIVVRLAGLVIGIVGVVELLTLIGGW